MYLKKELKPSTQKLSDNYVVSSLIPHPSASLVLSLKATRSAFLIMGSSSSRLKFCVCKINYLSKNYILHYYTYWMKRHKILANIAGEVLPY